METKDILRQLREKQISDAAPDDHKHNYAELNEAFRNLLTEIGRKNDGC